MHTVYGLRLPVDSTLRLYLYHPTNTNIMRYHTYKSLTLRLISPHRAYHSYQSTRLEVPSSPSAHSNTHTAIWLSEVIKTTPSNILNTDSVSPDAFMRNNNSVIWRGDYHKGKTLLHSVSKLLKNKYKNIPFTGSLCDVFLEERRRKFDIIQNLSRILVEFDADYTLNLPRAPSDLQKAYTIAYGNNVQNLPIVTPLREVLGMIGSYQWSIKGVHVPVLSARIYPHFGVFAPQARQEYVELLQSVPLPRNTEVAFDIGTGTGVLTAVLLKRGVGMVVASDASLRAVRCARDNLIALGLDDRAHVIQADIYPKIQNTDGRVLADVIVCNPPWLPCAPSENLLDKAVYDADSYMLRGYLRGLKDNLAPEGRGFLIISDLAERIGLRSRTELLHMFSNAGLTVIDKLDTTPCHPKSADVSDPLHAARASEITSLWVLGINQIE